MRREREREREWITVFAYCSENAHETHKHISLRAPVRERTSPLGSKTRYTYSSKFMTFSHLSFEGHRGGGAAATLGKGRGLHCMCNAGWTNRGKPEPICTGNQNTCKLHTERPNGIRTKNRFRAWPRLHFFYSRKHSCHRTNLTWAVVTFKVKNAPGQPECYWEAPNPCHA